MKRRISFFFHQGKALMITTAFQFMAIAYLYAQENQQGVKGIDAASSNIKGFFNAGTNLVYAIGACVGLIGAVKVYQKWNSGDQDTNRVATAWFGSCIFLVIVATVLKSFFNIV